MNIALTKHFKELIERLVASGRYNNSSEVVHAGFAQPGGRRTGVGHGVVFTRFAPPPLRSGGQPRGASHRPGLCLERGGRMKQWEV